MDGYLHPGYTDSLVEYGNPRKLSRSGGWVLERQIPGFPYRDAMGCYPLFLCQNWSQLHADLEILSRELVSLTIVTDPFGDYNPAYLNQCFRDVMFPFKEHCVVDLHQSMSTFVSAHHRRNVRKAFRELEVETCRNPAQFIDDWIGLYKNLIKRHDIKGLAAFSNASFAKQLEVPGVMMFRAISQKTTVGMTLWYIQNDIGYYHLGAFSPAGYKLLASFALFWFAIDYFSGIGLRWLNLGAGAGIKDGGTGGLNRFKYGWSTGSRTVYFCGRIFDQKKYMEIMRSRGIPQNKYFPAYRKDEFC